MNATTPPLGIGQQQELRIHLMNWQRMGKNEMVVVMMVSNLVVVVVMAAAAELLVVMMNSVVLVVKMVTKM